MIPVTLLRQAVVDRGRLSPNYGARPPGTLLRLVVLHATADAGNEEAAEAWLCSPDSGVSAHLHLRRDGTVVRLVPDALRAWHAGESRWQEAADVNDVSLGWELANRDDGREPFTEAQYAAVVRLAAHYAGQGLPLDAFVAHRQVAWPRGRKTDPRGFDWPRFRAALREELERDGCLPRAG